MARPQRSVRDILDDQLVLEALGVGEAHQRRLDLAGDVELAKAVGPERERVRRADTPHHPVGAAGTDAAARRPRVFEEREVGSG